MKKKILTVLLAATMVLSLAACGKTEEAPTEEAPVAEEVAVSTPEPQPTEEPTPEPTVGPAVIGERSGRRKDAEFPYR